MKILIINGYGKSVAGVASFEQYKRIIQEILMGKKEMIDTEIEFFIRDRESIDEFLYEIDSSFVRIESGKMFDSIDLVFFEGDANLRPWSPNAYKLLIFLRMCMRSNKILFASSFAMQGLVFLIASNVECNLSMINGLNGGQLGDLSKIRKNLNEIRQTDYFLDNVTGDLYGFNYDTGEWVTKGNAGLHYRRAAEEFKTIGKYIMKAPVYKGTKLKELDALYISQENEGLCAIRKNNMHHYLISGLPFEFVVPLKNSWDVHPFNFVNPKKTFQTLADGEKGPLVISVSDNIAAVQFGICKKYKETMEIMKNFMGYQLTKLCSGKSRSLPIEIASIKQNDNAMDIYLEHMSKNKYTSHQKTIKFNVITEFHHAGYAAKKSKGLDVVVNNAIGTKKFKQIAPPKQVHTIDKLLEMHDQSQAIDQLPSIHSQSLQSQNIQPINNQQEKVEREDSPVAKDNFKTGTEIKLLLHPTIDRSLLPDSKPLWVPGFLSQHRQSEKQVHKQLTIQDEMNSPQITKIYNDSRRYVSTTKVRSGSQSQQERFRFRIINKDRWIASHDFKV